MTDRIINAAIEEAKKSIHRQRVGAVIFDKNKIISVGHNEAQRSVRSISKEFLPWPYSIHAEVSCILRSKINLRRKSILVVRINNRDELRLARPCKYCLQYLEFVGIKNIYYSTDGGIVMEEF